MASVKSNGADVAVIVQEQKSQQSRYLLLMEFIT